MFPLMLRRPNTISDYEQSLTLRESMPCHHAILTLEFNDGPLTLIYGQNASGKSGYIRVLKHCSGQRKPGALLKDVFSKTNETQSCKFKFAINGAEKEAQWQLSTGPVDELRALQVYDSNFCIAIHQRGE